MLATTDERIIPHKKFDVLSTVHQFINKFFFFAFLAFFLLAGIQTEFQQKSESYLSTIFLAGLGINISFSIFLRWFQKQRWFSLAEEIGLQTELSGNSYFPKLYGTLRGHRIEVFVTSNRQGRTRINRINYHINLTAPIKEHLSIEERSLSLLNHQKTGDEEFDKRFSAESSSDQLLNHILRSPRLRLGMLQLGEHSHGFYVKANQIGWMKGAFKFSLTDGAITFSEVGHTTDTDYLHAVLNFLIDIAIAAEQFSKNNNPVLDQTRGDYVPIR